MLSNGKVNSFLFYLIVFLSNLRIGFFFYVLNNSINSSGRAKTNLTILCEYEFAVSLFMIILIIIVLKSYISYLLFLEDVKWMFLKSLTN